MILHLRMAAIPPQGLRDGSACERDRPAGDPSLLSLGEVCYFYVLISNSMQH